MGSLVVGISYGRVPSSRLPIVESSKRFLSSAPIDFCFDTLSIARHRERIVVQDGP